MGGRLDGKRVLVTGTGGGQGAAVQALFAAEGARVRGCDVIAGAAERTAAALRAEGHDVAGATLDLGDAEAAGAWVDRCAEELGGIDVVYNNAGAARFAPIDEMTVDDWDFVVRNELSLIFYVTRPAWRHLRASRGTVINVGSVMGMQSHGGIPSVAHRVRQPA